MASLLQAFLGRIQIPTGQTFNVTQGGSTPFAPNPGRYYPSGYTGEADNQLMEALTALLAPLTGDPEVTLSLTTGLVTFDWDSTSTSLDWYDATWLRDVLGFTGNLGAATSHTGTYPMRYVWLPSLAPADFPTTINDLWEPYSNSRVIASPDGNSHGRKGYESFRATLPYNLLDASEVVHYNATYDCEDNGTFRSFFRNVAHETMPLRVVIDRATYAATSDFKTALFGRSGGDAPLGSFGDYARPAPQAPHALWDVTVPLIWHDDTE